jgi:hypothetical protein
MMIHKKVVSRRNAGFGDNLFAAAHAWYYAKSTNRSLVINWSPSMYLPQKRRNAFSYFFEVPDRIQETPVIVEDHVNIFKRTGRQLPLFPRSYFLPTIVSLLVFKVLKNKTPSFLLKILQSRKQATVDIIKQGRNVRNRVVIFNSNFSFLDEEIKPFYDELKLKAEYQKIVDHFAKKYFEGKTVLGVHIRSYNINMPSNHNIYWKDEKQTLKKITSAINQIIAERKLKNYVIFLATDSKAANEFIRANLNHVVTYNKVFHIEYNFSQHLKTTVDSAVAALIDMFLLAKSDILYRFPPTGSWFSHYASLYAKETIM